MILLDTHIRIWWVHDDPALPASYRNYLQNHEDAGFGVSIISCWEIAKLVELGRLELPVPVDEWISQALSYPGIQLLDLTPEIAVASTKLPSPFHKDPAEQMIVATSRYHGYSLMTVDSKIVTYPHVTLVDVEA